MNDRNPWRQGLLVGSLALAGGLVAALLIERFGPRPTGLSIPLPAWVLRSLGSPADHRAHLTKPEALWVLPIAALPFLVVACLRTLVDATRLQLALQLIARIFVLLVTALALAQPTLRTPIRGKSVVFVIDVSDSIDDDQLASARRLLDEGLAHIATERQSGVDPEDRTRLAVVTYAARARVLPIGPGTDAQTLDAQTLVQRHPDGSFASDHAGAIRLATALIDPQTDGRIVLVTDGGGSIAEREDLSRATEELAATSRSLHVRRFEPVAHDDVWVEAVHLPPELRVGETIEVAIEVVASTATEVTIHLDRNGEPNPIEPQRTLTLRPGLQEIRIAAQLTEPGPAVFTARLASDKLAPQINRREGNDAAAVVGEVRGRPRILVVGSGDDEPLAAALRSDHLDVDVRSGVAMPDTVDGLRAFDLVMFSDIPSQAVPIPARLALERYVVDHGGGFVMVGGEHAFGLGGWERTSVEDLLPVHFEGERQREQPKLALVLVIDKSGSMSSEDKLDLVKEAARATARTLDPSDELGVIAFDSRPHTLVRLQPASNRIRIAADIRRLTSGGGTNALPALREAYLQLAGSNALIKHVILLSDGQSPENGISALLGDMRDANITVSSVGVGAGAGKDLLRRIAHRGRGRFYSSQDGTDVPRIFSRETREVTRNSVKERALFPRVGKNAQALRGIDFAGAPGLRGMVPIKPKPLAEVLLRTHLGEPLLVRGRRGLGRTAAFASDAKARWSAAWLGWSGFAKLWSQLARDTMRQGATLLGGATIGIHSTSDEGTYRVVVDVDAPEGFANELEGEIEVTDPAEPADSATRQHVVPLALSAPGRYEAEMRGISAGQRLVKARLYDLASSPKRLTAEATHQVSVPYPTEWLPSAVEAGVQQLASVSAVSRDGSIDDVLSVAGDPRGRERNRALWPYVLWAMLLPALLLDLSLRRISIGRRRLAI